MALKVGELFASFGIDTKDLDSAISGIEKKCQGIASSLEGFGKAASITLTAPITLAAKEIYKAGTAFDAEMSKVAAISGATGEDFDKLRAAAIEMGSTTSFSAAQSAEALEYMAMAGWKTEQMLDGLPGIMDLAAASGENLGTVSDIVTDALTAFGLKAEDAGHFADVLAAASSNANTNVSMMGETFKYAAPIAGAMGYSIEDTAVAIGLMANSGIKASQAGTSLRRIMTSLNGEIKISGEQLGKVSIQTKNADGSMREFNDIIGDCREAFKGLSESEKAQAAEALVGKNAMAGFLAIMNATDEDVDKLTEAITNCDGATQRMADTMLDNAQGDVTLFKSAVEGLEITLWELMEGPFRSITQYATKLVDSFRTASKSTQKMTLKFAGFAAAIGPASLAMSKVIKYAPMLTKALAAMVSPVGLVTAGLGLFALAAYDTMTSADAGFGGAAQAIAQFSQKAMWALQDLNKKIPDAMSKISKTFPIVANFLKTAITNLVPSIVDTASSLIKGFMDFFSENAATIADLGKTLVTGIVNGIAKNLPELIPAAAEFIASLASALIDNLPALLEAGVNLAKGIWEGLKNVDWAGLGSKLWTSLVNAVKSIDWGSVWTTITNALGAIGGWLKTKFEEAITAISNLSWSDIWDAITTALVAAGSWLLEKFSGVLTDITGLEWGDIWTAITTALSAAGSWLTEKFGGVLTDITGLEWGDIWTSITTALSEAGSWLSEKFGGNLTDITNLEWGDVWTAITTALSSAGTWLSDKFGEALSGITGLKWGGIWDAITNALGSIGDWFKGLFDPPNGDDAAAQAREWGSFGDTLKSTLEDALTGTAELISGIFSAGREAIEAFPWESTGEKLGTLAGNFAGFTIDAISATFEAGAAAIEEIKWDELGKTVGQAANGLTELTGEALAAAFKAGHALIEEIEWEDLGKTIGDIANGLVDLTGDALAGAFKAGHALIEAIDWEGLGKTIGDIANGLTDLTGDMLAGAFEAGHALIEGIHWTELGETIASVPNGLTDLTGEMLAGAFEAGYALISGIKWDELGETLAAVPNGLTELTGDALAGAFDAGHALITSLDWEGLGETLAAVPNGLTDLTGEMLAGAFETGHALISAIHWTELGETLAAVPNGLISVSGELLAEPFQTAAALIDGIEWDRIGDDIANGLNRAWGIVNDLADIGLSVGEITVGGTKAGVDWVKGLINGKNTDSEAKEAGKKIVQDVKKGVESEQNTLTITAETAAQLLLDGMTNILTEDAVQGIGSGFVTGIETGITTQSSSATTASETMANDTLSAAQDILTALAGQDIGIAWVDGIGTGIDTEEGVVSTFATTMATAVNTAAQDVLTDAAGQEIGTAFGGGIETGISDKQGPISSAAETAARGAYNAVKNLITRSAGNMIGYNFAAGIAAGIRNGKSLVISAAAEVANAAVSHAQAALRIESPSKVARDEIGKMFDAGLAVGLLDNRSTIISAANQVTDALRDSFYVGDPSRGTVYTSQESARQTARQTADATRDSGNGLLGRAREIGEAIADRLIASGALEGDVIMDKERVGRKTSKASSNEKTRRINQNVAGRTLQGVLS